ncbi:MAG: 6-phosphogluconolactonase [Desulfobulbus sp.]|jgi:6-phosphogluconolactonase|uniref:6-phosphogluconolactonase n=1 Tax=Desulfobulbus sp. TaxID=895 RepID=UPI002841E705|nr:6-phosphogluconolactonase [Desulfobulbus sp.]MDR2549606.1 6-phosphogluconolactonase [Desulfobulbus sp.]
MSGRGEVRVYADAAALGRAAAELFAEVVRAAVAESGRCGVLLAGGETPRRAYGLLAEEPLVGSVPWPQMHIFWGDERCLPAGDPRRNETMARRALLDRVPVVPDQVHVIDCAVAPERAAADYAERMRRFFGERPSRFDLALLGLGDDGHTASLLPGSAALAERHCWTAVTGRVEEPFVRVTLTAPLLNRSETTVFLVSGQGKAEMLRAALAGELPSLPVHLIRPEGRLLWLVDREAASLSGAAA